MSSCHCGIDSACLSGTKHLCMAEHVLLLLMEDHGQDQHTHCICMIHGQLERELWFA